MLTISSVAICFPSHKMFASFVFFARSVMHLIKCVDLHARCTRFPLSIIHFLQSHNMPFLCLDGVERLLQMLPISSNLCTKHYTEKQELNWIFHVNSSCLLWKPLPVRLYGLRCQFILFQFNCFASFTVFLSVCVLESTTSMSGINKCRNAEMWLNESYSNNNPAHPITWLLCVHFITRTNWLIKGK